MGIDRKNDYKAVIAALESNANVSYKNEKGSHQVSVTVGSKTYTHLLKQDLSGSDNATLEACRAALNELQTMGEKRFLKHEKFTVGLKRQPASMHLEHEKGSMHLRISDTVSFKVHAKSGLGRLLNAILGRVDTHLGNQSLSIDMHNLNKHLGLTKHNQTSDGKTISAEIKDLFKQLNKEGPKGSDENVSEKTLELERELCKLLKFCVHHKDDVGGIPTYEKPA